MKEVRMKEWKIAHEEMVNVETIMIVIDQIRDKTRFVPLKDIILNSGADNDFDTEDAKERASYIRKHGLRLPLVVSQSNKNEKYILSSSGERTWAALGLLQEKEPEKWNEIPIIVLEEQKERETFEKAVSNLEELQYQLKNRTKYYFMVFEVLLERERRGEIKEGQIAACASQFTGISDRFCRTIHTVYRYGSKELKSLLLEGIISIKDAAKIAKMDEEEQKYVLKIMRISGNKGIVKMYIKKYNKTARGKIKEGTGEEDLKSKLEMIRLWTDKCVENIADLSQKEKQIIDKFYEAVSR